MDQVWGQALLAFVTLAALEVVLGIDNVVFIAILSGKLPEAQQGRARRLGLAMAAIGRIILLFCVTWLVTLEKTVLIGPEHLPDFIEKGISVKDLILMLGGLFLLGKATWEIHENMEGHAQGTDTRTHGGGGASFAAVLGQILMLDLVFSIDSVLTAVGMVHPKHYADFAPFPFTTIPWPPLAVMIAAIVTAIAVMLVFVNPLSRFVQRHPTFKMLALSFLLLIGVILVAEGLHQHIPRGYIYFAMGFSLFVEVLNLRIAKKVTAGVK